MQYVLTALTGIMPFVIAIVIVTMAVAIRNRHVPSVIAAAIGLLLGIATEWGLGAWYFAQPGNHSGMAAWYVLSTLSLSALAVAAAIVAADSDY